MKNLWIAAGILAAMCIAAGANVLYLCTLTGELTGALEQAQALAEEDGWSAAAQVTAGARARFQERVFYLHVTLRHEDIDEVELSFGEVEQLLAHRERLGEYAAANARLITRLELLAESEHFTLLNIL